MTVSTKSGQDQTPAISQKNIDAAITLLIINTSTNRLKSGANLMLCDDIKK